MSISLSHLTKHYGKTHAVEDVNAEITHGSLPAILGPSGSGKSTLLKLISGLEKPDEGTVVIDGEDMTKVDPRHRDIGFCFQHYAPFRHMNVAKNVGFGLKVRKRPAKEIERRVNDLLALVKLESKAKSFPAQLSGGLAQRVQIARSIAHRPTVLFLDEPSAGLDPQSRMAMWTAVEGLRKEGITVLLTTHYMEEADSLANRVAIIDYGRVLALGSPEKLKATLGAHTIFDLKLKSTHNLEPVVASLKARPDVTRAEVTAEGLRVIAATSDGLLPDIVQAASSFGLRDLAITEPSLETVFIKLTGRDLRE